MTEFVGPSARQFFASVCDECIKLDSTEPIESLSARADHIVEPSKDLMAQLLRADGVGAKWAQGESICLQLRVPIRALDDILCHALEGIPSLALVYSSGRLEFQLA